MTTSEVVTVSELIASLEKAPGDLPVHLVTHKCSDPLHSVATLSQGPDGARVVVLMPQPLLRNPCAAGVAP